MADPVNPYDGNAAAGSLRDGMHRAFAEGVAAERARILALLGVAPALAHGAKPGTLAAFAAIRDLIAPGGGDA